MCVERRRRGGVWGQRYESSCGEMLHPVWFSLPTLQPVDILSPLNEKPCVGGMRSTDLRGENQRGAVCQVSLSYHSRSIKNDTGRI